MYYVPLKRSFSSVCAPRSRLIISNILTSMDLHDRNSIFPTFYASYSTPCGLAQSSFWQSALQHLESSNLEPKDLAIDPHMHKFSILCYAVVSETCNLLPGMGSTWFTAGWNICTNTSKSEVFMAVNNDFLPMN